MKATCAFCSKPIDTATSTEYLVFDRRFYCWIKKSGRENCFTKYKDAEYERVRKTALRLASRHANGEVQ